MWAYSTAWIDVNSTPSRTVRSRPSFALLRSPCCSAWCAQVTVVPESSRVSVLTSGSSKAGTASMPLGGKVAQALRTSSIGPSTRLPWNRAASKKIQNQATKNITSEAMNSTMP